MALRFRQVRQVCASSLCETTYSAYAFPPRVPPPEDAPGAVLPGPRSKSVDVQPSADAASVGFRTASLDVRVERTPLRLVVRDLSGNIISAAALGHASTF